MKAIYFLILTMGLCFSCNSPEFETAPVSTKDIATKIPGDFPANLSNPYDSAGEIYYDVSENYVTGNYYDEDVDGVITTVENLFAANLSFAGIKTASYVRADDVTIEAFLAGDSWMLSDAIATSGLSTASQSKLSAFLTALMQFESDKKSFDVIYPYIIAFEKEIGSSTILQADKKSMLTISSIMRFSFYFARKQKQKPRDRNWDITMPCIIAAVEGTKESIAKAVSLSVVTGISVNNYQYCSC